MHKEMRWKSCSPLLKLPMPLEFNPTPSAPGEPARKVLDMSTWGA
jgi:hypothetical protein